MHVNMWRVVEPLVLIHISRTCILHSWLRFMLSVNWFSFPAAFTQVNSGHFDRVGAVTHRKIVIFLKFSISCWARRKQRSKFSKLSVLCASSSHVKFNMRRKCVCARDTIYFGFASFVVETLHNLQLSTLLTQSVQIALSLATCHRIHASVNSL